MVNAVIMNDDDTVVTVTRRISSGDIVSYVLNGKIMSVKAVSEIPMYHKIAVKNVKKGNEIIKYGEKIGYATDDIGIGEYVHTNNLNS